MMTTRKHFYVDIVVETLSLERILISVEPGAGNCIRKT